jgi:hypothetical protein
LGLCQLFGEFHDQDGVLARQADQHHEADLDEATELRRHNGTTRKPEA